MSGRQPSYDLRRVDLDDVRELCRAHHGYGGCGRVAVECFGVFETGRIVAAFAWQPPPPGAAKSVCPEQPGAVLALSRMVAVPRDQRQINHISKPLRLQMRHSLDRSRWPVLVTYSDESLGHTGHVYKCSGWRKTSRRRVRIYEDSNGVRRSSYSAGNYVAGRLTPVGWAWLQRWEHWACEPGQVEQYMRAGGWVRRPVPGKTWRNGAQMHEWVNLNDATLSGMQATLF